MKKQPTEKDAATKFGEAVESLLSSLLAFSARLLKTLFDIILAPKRIIDSMNDEVTLEPKYVRPFTYMAIGSVPFIVTYKNQVFSNSLLNPTSLISSLKVLGNSLSPWQMITQSLPVIACILIASLFLAYLFPKSERGAKGKAVHLFCYCVGSQMLLFSIISLLSYSIALSIKYLVASQQLKTNEVRLHGLFNDADWISLVIQWFQTVAALATICVIYQGLSMAKNTKRKSTAPRMIVLTQSLLIVSVLNASSNFGATIFHSFSNVTQLESQELISLGNRTAFKPNSTVPANSVKFIDGQLQFKLFLNNPKHRPLGLFTTPNLLWLSWTSKDTEIFRSNLNGEGNFKIKVVGESDFLRVEPYDTNWISIELSIPDSLVREIHWPLKFVIEMPSTDGSMHLICGEIPKPKTM